MAQARIQWRSDDGPPILAVDYRELGTTQELLSLLEEQVRAEQACAPGTLVIADFRMTRLSADFLARAKLIGASRRATVSKTAILCTTELQHILLREYIFATGDHDVRSFTDEQSALRWLLH